MQQTANTLKKQFSGDLRRLKGYLKADIILAIIYIASIISPILTAITRVSLWTYPAFFAIYLAWFVSAILRYKKLGRKFTVDKSRLPEMAALLLWLLVIAVNILLGRGENGSQVIIYTIMFMTVYMMDYIYSTYNDRSTFEFLMMVALVILAITSIRSIIILQGNPLLARKMNAEYELNPDYYFSFEMKGLGDYPFFTTLSLIMPVIMFMAIKAKRWIPASIMVLLCTAAIFYSGYTGSTMLVLTAMIAFLIFSLFFYKNKKRRNRILLLIAAMAVVIAAVWGVFLPADTRIELNNKYIDLVNVIFPQDFQIPKIMEDPDPNGNPEDFNKAGYRTMARVSLYWYSIKTFIANPLFGVGPFFKTKTVANGIGGHSSWLDFLAMFGIIGCLPLITCFWLYFKRTFMAHKYAVNKFIRILGWIFFMGYGLLNPVFVARCFPVALCLFIAGSSPMGQNVPLRDWIKGMFKGKKAKVQE